jgi:hypothetical protein
MTEIVPNDKSSSVLSRWSASSWLGIAGSVAGIAALVTGVYFYYASQSYRILAYYVQPVKSVVVSGEQLSDLKVLYRNQEVKEVTTAQIAIWNQGKEPIRMEHVLEQVKIHY